MFAFILFSIMATKSYAELGEGAMDSNAQNVPPIPILRADIIENNYGMLNVDSETSKLSLDFYSIMSLSHSQVAIKAQGLFKLINDNSNNQVSVNNGVYEAILSQYNALIWHSKNLTDINMPDDIKKLYESQIKISQENLALLRNIAPTQFQNSMDKLNQKKVILYECAQKSTNLMPGNTPIPDECKISLENYLSQDKNKKLQEFLEKAENPNPETQSAINEALGNVTSPKNTNQNKPIREKKSGPKWWQFHANCDLSTDSRVVEMFTKNIFGVPSIGPQNIGIGYFCSEKNIDTMKIHVIFNKNKKDCDNIIPFSINS